MHAATTHRESHGGQADHAPSSTLAMQLRFVSALGVAAAMFWTVGWIVIQPFERHSPVTLLAFEHPAIAILALSALGVVAAGLAVMISGVIPTGIAPVGAAAGLAALSWRGGDADMIGGYLTGDVGAPPSWPTMSFLLELWLWLGIVTLGWLVGRAMAGRLGPTCPLESHTAKPSAGGKKSDGETAVLLSIMMTAVAAYGLLLLLGGPSAEAVLKQQVLFSIGGSFFVAAAVVRYSIPTRGAWWPIVSVGVVGTFVFLFGNPLSDTAPAIPTMRALTDVAMRGLPIQYAAFGAIGGILGLSMGASLHAAAGDADREASSTQ